MKNAVYTQLSIIFHKKGLQITFIIILLYAMSVSIWYGFLQKGYDAAFMYHPAMLSALNGDSEFIWYFIRLFPFLVVIPAGFILFTDRSAKISEMILVREGRFRYYTSKMIAAFIATFFVFTVPFFLEFLLNLVMIPNGATMSLTNWETYSKVYFDYANGFLLSDIFYKNIYLYNICSISLTGIFSGCVAVFIVGISTFPFKFRAFLMLPFYVLIYLMDIFLSRIEMPTYLDFYIATFDIVGGKKISYYVLYMLLLLTTGIGCVFINVKRGCRL